MENVFLVDEKDFPSKIKFFERTRKHFPNYD